MTQEEKTKIEERIVDVLKTVYDPEIPVNIWDLGMIYKIDVKDDGNVDHAWNWDLNELYSAAMRWYDCDNKTLSTWKRTSTF